MATTPSRRGGTPRFSLRPASAADYDFALALFLESPRALLEPLGKWDEARFTERFRQVFDPGAAQIILVRGAGIGWMHASEFADRIHLHYMLIAAPFRNRGIGTVLIRRLRRRALSRRKHLTLKVMRGNQRAIALYRREGLGATGGDAERITMRWKCPPAPVRGRTGRRVEHRPARRGQ